MSKYKIRIGNDFLVQWSFYQDKNKTIPLVLTGRTLSVYISTNFAKWKITPIQISGNSLVFTILGTDQVQKYGTGLMTLSCFENEGTSNQHAIDVIQPFLFVNQAEEGFRGSSESDYTLLEAGTAYFSSSVFYVYEQTVNKKSILTNSEVDYPNTFLLTSVKNELLGLIKGISGFGRYVAGWDCSTGTAQTNPPYTPYNYAVGDWMWVFNVAAAGQTNYKPNGTQYISGQASTTVETNTVKVLDVYKYNGNGVWELHSFSLSVVWGNISGTLSNQTDLQNALNALATSVTAETTRSQAAESLLTSAISNEVTRATNAENTLDDRIDNISAIGKFLSIWNCTTGLPSTNPTTSPYTYHTGDYYLVGVVGTSNNKKPSGNQYITGQASTTVESSTVAVGDIYMYDGSTWKLLTNSAREVAFSQIAGNPTDNTALAAALNAKYTKPSTGIPAIDLATGVQTSLGKADTALQSAALTPYRTASDQDDINAELRDELEGEIERVAADIAEINQKIPAQASAENKLADKAFVNSSIATSTATFKGTFDCSGAYGNSVVMESVTGSSATVLGELMTYPYPLFHCLVNGQPKSGQITSMGEGGEDLDYLGLYIGGVQINSEAQPNVVIYDDNNNPYTIQNVRLSYNHYELRFSSADAKSIDAIFKNDYRPAGILDCVTWANRGGVDANDYAYVISADSLGNRAFNRYKYGSSAWSYEFTLNNSSFTAAQWAAINSGITSGKFTEFDAKPTTAQMNAAIAAYHDSSKQDTISDLATIRSGAAAGATAVQPSTLSSYRTSAEQDTIDAGKADKSDTYTKTQTDSAISGAVATEATRAQATEAALQTATTELRADLNAIDVDNLGDVHAKSIDSDELPRVCGFEMFLKGTGAPSVTPDFIGQIYIDTTAQKVYMATGVVNASSFKVLN